MCDRFNTQYTLTARGYCFIHCATTLFCAYLRMYKTIRTTQPAYLNSVLQHYTPARTLRSSDTNLLSVPRVRTCFGSRSFSVAAPSIWNSLPFDIRNSCSIASFRCKLKTFYFSTSTRLAMSSAPSLLTPAPQIRPTLCAL